MSFWPKLRRRSKGRKKSSSAGAKGNPYAARENDRYAAVQAELEAERAKFAEEKGVPISVVRFVSRSSRGWVSLPAECFAGPVSSSDSPDSPAVDDGRRAKKRASGVSAEFSLPPPALPLPTPPTDSVARSTEELYSSGRLENVGPDCVSRDIGIGNNSLGRNSGKLVVSRELQIEAWKQMRNTAAVIFVKVLVVSRALEANKAIALTIAVVVDTWNRGKSTFQRVFSTLAAQLLTTVRPHFSLYSRVSACPLIRSPKPPLPSTPGSEMKVTPVSEIRDDHAQVLRSSSSFSFPRVPSGDLSAPIPTPLFSNQQPSAAPSPTLQPAVVPLTERNASPPKKSPTLKSKLFKCPAPTKGSHAVSPSRENAIPQAADPKDVETKEAAPSSRVNSISAPCSPSGGKCRNKGSFMRRKSSKGGDGESEDSERPTSSTSTVTKAASRSHESSFFRSPNNNEIRDSSLAGLTGVSPPVPAGAKSVSRSQELKFALKSLGKKKSSSSVGSSSPPPSIEDLALPDSTVQGLKSLAFRSNEENSRASPTRRCSILGSSSPKKDSSVRRRMSNKAGEGSKGLVSTVNSSKSTNLTTTNWIPAPNNVEEIAQGLRRSKTEIIQSSTSEYLAPPLRRVKTAIPKRKPSPRSQLGGLGKSELFSRDIVGAFLLLAILAFLQLGRLPAILATACLCLVLSGAQKFVAKNLTQRDRELLSRGPGGQSKGGSNSGVSGSPSRASGSPIHDMATLHSSEYRKRVLIEGLLDRGNRRGTAV